MSEQDLFSGQNIPPELQKRLLAVRSEEELNKLVKEHPQLIPIVIKMTASISDSQEIQIPDRLPEILEKLKRLKRPSEMPRRIALCEEALLLVDRKTEPELWAGLNGELANSLVQNPQDNRADNLELAIFHFNEATLEFTRVRFPEEWAMIQNNLGNAYSDRIRGVRADNIEKAIGHYNQALEVHTRERFPEKWAMIQNNLGNAYNNRIRGERADNIEKAIGHCNQALEIRTREKFPEDWAATKHNLGIIYWNRI